MRGLRRGDRSGWRSVSSVITRLNPATVDAACDGVVAGAVAWALSGIPSTVHALVRGVSPLQAVRAAGTLALSPHASPNALAVAGVAVHTGLSLGWATLFALALPVHRTVPVAVAAGLAVAALDLGSVGRRYPHIRALPSLPQISDHLAFGALVGAVVSRRRSSRCEVEGSVSG